jgi:hypothetical protein
VQLQQQQMIQQQQQSMQQAQDDAAARAAHHSARVAARAALAAQGVDAPTFWPPPDEYPDSAAVTLSDDVPGAMVFYTLDGSYPTTRSPRYVGPIMVAATTKIVAIAVAPNGAVSRLSSGTFVIPDSSATRSRPDH